MTIQNIICDIDGVLMHDNVAVPGAAEFIKRILDKGMPLVMLTNYPSQTGQDLANRFATAGIDVPDTVQSRLYHHRCEPGFCHRRGNPFIQLGDDA